MPTTSLWLTLRFGFAPHQYRDAVGDCENDSLTDNNASVHATDEAMAFYTGELEGQTGFNYARDNAGDLVNKVGYLMHNLADKRCANFGTCTGLPENTSPDPDNTAGASAVNSKVAAVADTRWDVRFRFFTAARTPTAALQ